MHHIYHPCVTIPMLRTAAQVSFLVNKDHDRKASNDEPLPHYAGARGEIFVLQERLH
jgi:hypothetical protein